MLLVQKRLAVIIQGKYIVIILKLGFAIFFFAEKQLRIQSIFGPKFSNKYLEDMLDSLVSFWLEVATKIYVGKKL